MNKTVLITILSIVVIAGVFFMAGKNNSAQDSAKNTNTTEVGENQSSPLNPSGQSAQDVAEPNGGAIAEQTDSEVKEFVVDGFNFGFSLSEIRVKKGDRVRIVFKNTGGYHDFNIDELNVKTKIINTGEQETVEFVADKVGEFEYYCSVGNHRELGMRGKFIVE